MTMKDNKSSEIIPFGDLTRSKDSAFQAVQSVLESGKLIGGYYVEKFEAEMAKYLETPFLTSVASGTDALTLGLKSLDLPLGSRVLVADNAGGYASIATQNAGYIPIFCDVNLETALIDLENILKINQKFSAIIVTHLYGKMANVEEIVEWAAKHGIFVIEDCAQSIGAKSNGKYSGTIAHIGCFSFYPTKNLNGIGDGGAICTNDEKLFRRIKALKQYGWEKRYFSEFFGGQNSRLDAINASVLSFRLANLNQNNEKRRQIHFRYANSFKKGAANSLLSRQNSFSDVFHLSVFRVNEPQIFLDFFMRNGIECSRHYPFTDSSQPGIHGILVSKNENANQLCREVVSLPLYPELNEFEINRVCETIDFWSKEFANA